MRPDLLGPVRSLFARAGYYLSEATDGRPLAFDFIGRRDGELVVVKVASNVDGITELVATEMKALAHALSASPLVVGERSSARELEEGAIYMRHGVPIVSRATVEAWLLGGTPPLVYAAPGGFYVTLDGARLRRIRADRGISLGQLAEAAGVSRRAISLYEEGMGAMVEVAERLEAYLDEPLVRPVDPMRAAEAIHEAVVDLDRLAAGLERDALSIFAALGFRVVPLAKSPMNAVSRGEDATVLTGIPGGDAEAERRRARAVADLSAVAETDAAIVVERRTTRVALEGTAVVAREEIALLREPEDLLALIRERKGRTR